MAEKEEDYGSYPFDNPAAMQQFLDDDPRRDEKVWLLKRLTEEALPHNAMVTMYLGDFRVTGYYRAPEDGQPADLVRMTEAPYDYRNLAGERIVSYYINLDDVRAMTITRTTQ